MKAVVASGHQQVCEAAGEMLKNGGNAFDAAVAGGFASAVAEPLLTSLGGGGFLLARTDSGKSTLFDFFVDTPGRGLAEAEIEPDFLPVDVHFPGSVQVFNVGYGSVAVPGVLRGLLHVHRKFGRLPLHEIIAPAVELARNGVALNRTQAYILALLEPIMRLTECSRTLYFPKGKILQSGCEFKNPDLADFLESLPACGERDFYEGELARRIAADMSENHGLLTAADLAAYKVIERKPLRAPYRRYELLTNPLPSFGGFLLTIALRYLQESMPQRPLYGSKSHIIGLLTLLQHISLCRENAHFFTHSQADEDFNKNFESIRKAFGGTTHLSILDAGGNAASLTCSNGEGSGYIMPGTGIMLNNMMGEDDLHPQGFHLDPPGKRIASMMSPSILLENGRPKLVIGSGGSKRIWSALLQVISAIIDFEQPVAAAVAAPRMHWDGELAQIEPGFAGEVISALQKKFPLNIWQVKDVYFGGVHAVAANGEGGGDQRRDGAVITV